MTTHTYPLIAVLGDYARSAVGIAVSVVPLVVVDSKPFITWLFAAMLVVFAAFGLRTILRHRTRIEISDEGIAVNLPRGKGIAWSQMDQLRVKFFSTHRKKKTGWFQVTVRGAGQAISVDSKISGFRAIVERARQAAAANGIDLDETSTANIEAMDDILPQWAT